MSLFDYCPVCGMKNILPLRKFKALHLYKCRDCAFVFDQRKPSNKEFTDHYKQYSYSSLKECSPPTINSYNRLLDEFELYKKTGNILDVGCGQGDFLNEARKRGWRIFGSEYSESAVALLLSRGIKAEQGELTAKMYGDVQFDVITSFEVIEHINNSDTHFKLIYNKLRQGGLFYCTTPNFNALLRYLEKDSFPIICYPEHISFYTKTSLIHQAVLHGFNIKKIQTTGLDLRRLKDQLYRDSTSMSNKNNMRVVKFKTDAFRVEVEASRFLRSVKKWTNWLLSATQSGDTLKAYLIKK